MIERIGRIIPDRPAAAVLTGAGLLLAGLLAALLLAGALAAILGLVGGRDGMGAYLQLLALPAFAVAASAWILAVVSRVGLRAARPTLGLASYALLLIPLILAWLVPATRASIAPSLTVVLLAGAVPAYMGTQVARNAPNP